MILTWYGHAAFGLEGRDGAGRAVRIILDPYNYPACGGYLPIDEAADIVSISHHNPRYHSDLSSIRGEPLVFDALRRCEESGGACTATVRDVPFAAHLVQENARGDGPNAMVELVLDDGLVIAHLGDLGHPLAGPSREFLRGCHVLLALAGGKPTIALDDLHDLAVDLEPRIVVPMHFKTPKVNLDLLPLDAFLARFSDWPLLRPGRSSVELALGELPRTPSVLVLDHAR